MRILQINVASNWGSTGRIVEDIGKTLLTHGDESYIAFGRYANPSKSHTQFIGNKIDVYRHLLVTRLLDRHGLSSKTATLSLIDYIKEISPDLIHLHNIHGYYLNYTIFFSFLKEYNKPIVWTLHDCWPFTGHCAYFSYFGCDKWKIECGKCPLLHTYPQSFGFDRSKLNFYDKKSSFLGLNNLVLVSVSSWLAGLVKESFLNKYPIRIIHNGIDLDKFVVYLKPNELKQKLGLPQCFIVLGVASIWEKRKGLYDFIKLREKLPMDIRIVLVGVKESQRKKLPCGIITIPRTNCIEELTQYYSAADVFFNPTWEDNFPTTNLEALACGTPIITYRTGGSIEAVDENTGFIVEQGDLNSVVNIIHQIRRVGKEKYSTACRNRAIDEFDKKECYNKYLEIYKSLINKL